ncbi:MAG: hypothetical protein ACREAC_26865, partial [Blastocatellia bacterium]
RVMDALAIPRFSSENVVHKNIADLGRRIHLGQRGLVREFLNKAVAPLWGIADSEQTLIDEAWTHGHPNG